MKIKGLITEHVRKPCEYVAARIVRFWKYLTDLLFGKKNSNIHYNFFYFEYREYILFFFLLKALMNIQLSRKPNLLHKTNKISSGILTRG